MKTISLALAATAVLWTGAVLGDDGPGEVGSSPALTTRTGGGGGGIVTIPTQTGCPTVTATRELCGTCAVPACLGLATVTQYPCSCPAAIPTVYLDFPCDKGCKGIGCSTSFDIVTASETCPTYPPSSPPTYTPTPTPTTYPPTTPPPDTKTYPTTSLPTGTGTPPRTTTTSRPPFVNAAPRMGPFAMFRLW